MVPGEGADLMLGLRNATRSMLLATVNTSIQGIIISAMIATLSLWTPQASLLNFISRLTPRALELIFIMISWLVILKPCGVTDPI